MFLVFLVILNDVFVVFRHKFILKLIFAVIIKIKIESLIKYFDINFNFSN